MLYFLLPDRKEMHWYWHLKINGKDWEKVGLSINAPAEVCQDSFIELQKQSQKDEKKFKKLVLGTGTIFVMLVVSQPLNLQFICRTYCSNSK